MTTSRSVLLISLIALILAAFIPAVSADEILMFASDGKEWTQATASAGWDGREFYTSVVYDGKMWVIGGRHDGSHKNDVWWSTDGITWTQATASAGWSVRQSHTSVVYDGKMWVMGGVASGSRKNDVWWSTDGITWTRATASAEWSPRSGHTSVVYDGKMWVMGGYDGSSYKNDVWWSTDGITWTQATASAEWRGREYYTSVVYDDKMWVMGGNAGARKNDVWWSTDGITWTQATASAKWSPRECHTSVVYDGKMWVIGGRQYDGSRKNDVWWSTDGITWTQATASAEWSARYSQTSVVYDDKMWVMGGYDGSCKNDVWWFTVGGDPTSRTVTVTMTDIDGNKISGFDVKAVNAYTGESYTASTDSDVAYITLPMDRTARVPNPQTGEYEDAPVGYYYFYGSKPGYKMVPDWAIQVIVLPEKYLPDVFCDIIVAPVDSLRTVTVTMTDIDGNKISGFDVKAVNAYTGESYTIFTDSDVAYITLPMDRTARVPNPETGEYEEAPVGYYLFYGYKPGYKMFPDYAIQVNVLPEKYMPDIFCDIIVAPVGSIPDEPPGTSPVIVSVRNAQTGALIADATVIIKDTRTDPWTEVVNQTVPSGQGTFYLANDPANNPNQYYITALVPGYSDIYNGRFFNVTGLIYITVYMEPIEGGPADENNTILEFYVRNPDGNPVSDAMVSVADEARWTNAQGWIRFEVPKNAAYSYTVRKFGYVTLEGTATVGDGPRYVVNVVLTPESIPTQPPGPGVPTQPPGGIPGDDGSEGFLSEAVRGIGKLFGVGFSTAKILLGMLLALSIGFTTAKKLRGGAAEFGLGLLGGTMLGVLVGLLPVWTIVVLLLVVGMYIGYRYVGGGSNG